MGSKKRASQSLEIQVRELRTEVDKITEAVELMERAMLRVPCYLCWVTGMCAIGNMPGQLCGPPEYPAGRGQLCGPPERPARTIGDPMCGSGLQMKRRHKKKK